MGLEIERKFLCNLTKEEALKLSFSNRKITSIYLENTKESSFRIVQEINEYDIVSAKMTHKKTIDSTLVREEKETSIPSIVYDSIDKFLYPFISKHRYLINVNNNIWEVDFFDNYDFVIAEIEFKSVSDANNFKDFPVWILEEVTDKPFYLNCNLATIP